ncbi:MAG TPA: response regulator [Candidatus Dormibacteraeota bacterium]|nr:response regulator [Candidatus Dormibacteraeota bacterium]
MVLRTEDMMAGVLLVEDDAAIADLYALKLRLDGYTVSVACDPISAGEAFERERPAVVCLDVRLPGGGGEALAERFSAAGACVVLLTNDQSCYERPPRGVTRSLLKAQTNPAQLSATLAELLSTGT